MAIKLPFELLGRQTLPGLANIANVDLRSRQLGLQGQQLGLQQQRLGLDQQRLQQQAMAQNLDRQLRQQALAAQQQEVQRRSALQEQALQQSQQQQILKQQFGQQQLQQREQQHQDKINFDILRMMEKRGVPLSSAGKTLEDARQLRLAGRTEEADLLQQSVANKQGLVVETMPDGSTRIVQGPITADTLTKPTKTKLEKDLINQTVQLQDLENLKSLYNPNFLTWMGGLEYQTARTASKAGLASDDQKDLLRKRAKFKSNVSKVFNQYRKDITGAAASIQELKMLENSIISMNDSPEEFEAKLNGMMQTLKRHQRIKQRLLQKGLRPGTKKFGEEFDKLNKVSKPRKEEKRDQDPDSVVSDYIIK